jgi:hypothetical protein
MILLSGCGSSTPKYKLTPVNNWIEHSDGSILTWDAERLQKVVPFKIIFPKYLPEDLKAYPPELTKMTLADSVTEIRISYQPLSGSGYIDIEENDSVTEWVPNEDHTYLDISGTRVLEEKGFYARPGYSDVPNMNYMWNRDNIDFRVIVTGYDKTEGRKIVESMINQ